MKGEEYFDRMDAYATENMSAEERQAFEQDLTSDTGLQQAWKTYQIAREAVGLLSEDALQEKLKRWRADAALTGRTVPIRDPEKEYRYRQSPLRWLAAAVLLLGLSYAGYFLYDRFTEEEPLFASLNKPIEGEGYRGGEDVAWIRGYEAYREGSFEQAVGFFQSVATPDDELRYYLGHSYYLMGDFSSAEQWFKSLIGTDESTWREEAEWALLATWYHDVDRATSFDSLLMTIAGNPGHSFHEEALRVKEKIAEGN